MRETFSLSGLWTGLITPTFSTQDPGPQPGQRHGAGHAARRQRRLSRPWPQPHAPARIIEPARVAWDVDLCSTWLDVCIDGGAGYEADVWAGGVAGYYVAVRPDLSLGQARLSASVAVTAENVNAWAEMGGFSANVRVDDLQATFDAPMLYASADAPPHAATVGAADPCDTMQLDYRVTVDMIWEEATISGNSIDWQYPSNCAPSGRAPAALVRIQLANRAVDLPRAGHRRRRRRPRSSLVGGRDGGDARPCAMRSGTAPPGAPPPNYRAAVATWPIHKSLSWRPTAPWPCGRRVTRPARWCRR